MRDLAQRPNAPEISDAEIVSGKWAATLTDLVKPHTADFAAYLGRARPLDHADLTGPSASERLVAALRVLDEAALILQKRIPKAASRQALPSIAEYNAAKRSERAQRDANRAAARTKASSLR